MAENEAGAAVQEETEFQYPTKVEDVGPATKKITIEIPQERIAAKLDAEFKELRSKAAIPGFRPGHAPRKLVEKRFNADVKDDVRRALVSESYQQALAKNSLQVLGEPEFENADAIKLPDSGPLSFTFQIEVQPNITLPELKGVKVKRPKVEVADSHVEEALKNLRQQQGTLVPVENRGIQAGDYLAADIVVKLGDKEVFNQKDAQLVARPGRLAGIEIADLDKQLEGLKSGETKTLTVKASESHPSEEMRGQDVTLQIILKDIKALEPAEINAEFLGDLGFENEQQLRDALREQLLERIKDDVQQSMRQQVHTYLLDNVQIELPAKLSARQESRVVSRRAVELMMRGMPREQVEAAIEQLKAGAADVAARELKLFFILQKVAADNNIDVDEAELNGRIAAIAIQRGRRPEKLKQEMSSDGTLSELYLQIREQKAVDKILESAEVEEVALEKKE